MHVRSRKPTDQRVAIYAHRAHLLSRDWRIAIVIFLTAFISQGGFLYISAAREHNSCRVPCTVWQSYGPDFSLVFNVFYMYIIVIHETLFKQNCYLLPVRGHI